MKNRRRPSWNAVLRDKHVRGAGAPQCRRVMGHERDSAHLTTTALCRRIVRVRRWTGEWTGCLWRRWDAGLKCTEAEQGRDPAGVVWSHCSGQKKLLWTGKTKERLCLASLTKCETARSTLFDFNLGGNVWNCRERLQGPREEPLRKLFPFER